MSMIELETSWKTELRDEFKKTVYAGITRVFEA